MTHLKALYCCYSQYGHLKIKHRLHQINLTHFIKSKQQTITDNNVSKSMHHAQNHWKWQISSQKSDVNAEEASEEVKLLIIYVY